MVKWTIRKNRDVTQMQIEMITDIYNQVILWRTWNGDVDKELYNIERSE
jgi:hypothetical protein